MTREILFRGKTIKEEWVYGLLAHLGNAWFISNQSGVSTAYEVIPSTIGQFTGLTDKNGKRIFEGDIVEFLGMRGRIVQECGAYGIATTQQIDYDLLESKIPFQNNANFCFNDNFISLWELWWNYQQDDEPLEVVEVIGNIHDNPEIREATKNETD